MGVGTETIDPRVQELRDCVRRDHENDIAELLDRAEQENDEWLRAHYLRLAQRFRAISYPWDKKA